MKIMYTINPCGMIDPNNPITVSLPFRVLKNPLTQDDVEITQTSSMCQNKSPLISRGQQINLKKARGSQPRRQLAFHKGTSVPHARQWYQFFNHFHFVCSLVPGADHLAQPPRSAGWSDMQIPKRRVFIVFGRWSLLESVMQLRIIRPHYHPPLSPSSDRIVCRVCWGLFAKSLDGNYFIFKFKPNQRYHLIFKTFVCYLLFVSRLYYRRSLQL